MLLKLWLVKGQEHCYSLGPSLFIYRPLLTLFDKTSRFQRYLCMYKKVYLVYLNIKLNRTKGRLPHIIDRLSENNIII